jgi:hypothetical protein
MKIKRRPLVNRAAAKAPDFPERESEFREVVDLIRGARQHALQAVNTSLVALYWEVGRYQACPNVAVLKTDKSMKELAKTRI